MRNLSKQTGVRKVSTNSLRPHPLNEKIYPVNEEEDRELEESIRRYGLFDRLVATPEGLIVHGARRWRIAKKLGIKEVECEFREFEDPELAVIEFNRYRKKTPRIIKNEYDFLRKKLAPKARERQLSQLKPFQKTEEEKKKDFGGVKFDKTETEEHPKDSDAKSGTTEKGSFVKSDKTEGKIHVRDEAAKRLNISSGQLHKIDYIYSHEDEAKDIVEKLDRGEISVHQAYEKIKKRLEPKPKEEKEKTWKCDACEHEFSELDPVVPTRYTLCPNCLVEFETWKVEKLYDSDS